MGVTFSELGPDSSGDRSSMPSEAMSTAVRNDGAAEEAAAAASGGSWLHRVFTQHGGAAGGLLVVGAESLLSSSPGDGSLEGGGAPR